MRNIISNKKFIIFGTFSLIVVFSIYLVVGKDERIGGKIVVVNDTIASTIEMNELNNDEISLGDDVSNCKTTSTSWTTATKTFSKSSKCKTTCSSCNSDGCIKSCSSDGLSGTKCVKNVECTSCNSGYYLENKRCHEIKVTSVTNSDNSTKYLAKGESATFTFKATGNPSSAQGFSPRWGVSPSGGAQGSGSGSTYSLKASGSKTGSGTGCETTTYTVKAESGGVTKSATAKVCVYCSEWKGPIGVKYMYKTKQNTSPTAQGCYYFIGEQAVEGGYSYTGYYTRCCGGTPNQSDLGACYGDKEYLGIAGQADWLVKASGSLTHKYTNVASSDCHPIKVDACEAKLVPPSATTLNTDKCEDTKVISYKDTTKCSNNDGGTTNNFYTIECDRTISTSFDYGNDGIDNTSHVLHQGQGFGFAVKVTSTHTCTAKFDDKAWKSAYDLLIKKIGFVSQSLIKYVEVFDHSGWEKAVNALNASPSVKSEVYELWNKLEKLKDIVIDGYAEFKPHSNYDEEVGYELSYSVNGQPKKLNGNLIVGNVNEGEYLKTVSQEKYNLTSKYSLLQNIPAYYVMTNTNNPRVITFIPQRSYVERYIGKDLTNNEEDIDGGNKIYLDYGVDPTSDGKSYKLTLNVSKLGSNKSSVINDKCNVYVVEDKMLYRSIDVSIPFINANWNIGKNWLNNKYSFTNTIKSDTWSSNKLAEISISSSEIDSLKESNKTNVDLYPYLGLCDRINKMSQDSITQKICGTLKNTFD